MARSLVTLDSLTRDELLNILDRVRLLKPKIQKRETLEILRNRIVGLLFEKPSTRTRASFEAAALRLGGKTLYLSAHELQLTRGEPVKDTARILGSYLDALVVRVYSHHTVEDLAQYSSIPVINGLSDLVHPTQAVCDLFTILEAKGRLEGLTLAYIGDGNNVCHSLLLACAMAGIHMTVACPKGYEPSPERLAKALRVGSKNGARLKVLEDPVEAARGADILYTDVWVSMGEEDEKETKLKVFQGYQINSRLLGVAAKDALVMHCLPAYRGLEITDEVIEGPQSIVWRQGENKMHGAAGILDYMLS